MAGGKIVIIGPYPPPYGGISIHIQRVLEYLKNDDYLFFNETYHLNGVGINFKGKRKAFKSFNLLFRKYKVIHHHSPDNFMRVLLCLFGIFRTNIYLHIHGESLSNAFKNSFLLHHFYRFFLRYVHILADNDDIVRLVQSCNPRSINKIDAFLPPKFDEDTMSDFFCTQNLHYSPLNIVMVGWFKEYRSQDLYGFDIALEALKLLKERHGVNVNFIASVNGIMDEEIYTNFIEKRSGYNLNNEFILLEDNTPEIWPIYLAGNIFIRPTNTDGNSVAINEALWFGMHVITSDVIPRPDECILFENRNVDDLCDKILQLLKENSLSVIERVEKVKSKKFIYPLFTKIYGCKE